MLYLVALIVGIVAGLRTFTAPAAVSWAAHGGWLHLDGTWASFMGSTWTPWIFTALALLEYAGDQLPSTPSRKVPAQFGARLLSGAFSGAVIGTAGGSPVGGAIVGLLGAAVGTYGGAAVRSRLAAAFGRDRPAALLEDLIAVVVAAGALAMSA